MRCKFSLFFSWHFCEKKIWATNIISCAIFRAWAAISKIISKCSGPPPNCVVPPNCVGLSGLYSGAVWQWLLYNLYFISWGNLNLAVRINYDPNMAKIFSADSTPTKCLFEIATKSLQRWQGILSFTRPISAYFHWPVKIEFLQHWRNTCMSPSYRKSSIIYFTLQKLCRRKKCLQIRVKSKLAKYNLIEHGKVEEISELSTALTTTRKRSKF